MNRNAICQIKTKGRWKRMAVTKAKGLRLPARCIFPKCHGCVRLHSKGGPKSPAHYEHYPKFEGCPHCQRFDGTVRRNPNSLK